jgi:hypothetical protein
VSTTVQYSTGACPLMTAARLLLFFSVSGLFFSSASRSCRADFLAFESSSIFSEARSYFAELNAMCIEFSAANGQRRDCIASLAIFGHLCEKFDGQVLLCVFFNILFRIILLCKYIFCGCWRSAKKYLVPMVAQR